MGNGRNALESACHCTAGTVRPVSAAHFQKAVTMDITTGRGVVIAVEHHRAWIETASGGRLFFPMVAWKSPGRPVVGDRVVYRQFGPDFKRVLKADK